MLLTINFKTAEIYKCYPIREEEVDSYLYYFGSVCSNNDDAITGFSYERFNEDNINIGDEYINIMTPDNVRIADEETLRRVKFAKAMNYGTCYYKKLN